MQHIGLVLAIHQLRATLFRVLQRTKSKGNRKKEAHVYIGREWVDKLGREMIGRQADDNDEDINHEYMDKCEDRKASR